MDLNDIQLSGSQLAGLYAQSLVEITPAGGAATPLPVPRETPAPPAPAAPKAAAPAPSGTPQTPAFLGQNSRGILVVTDEAGAPYLADADLAFLTNVLGACGLGLGDVAIVNWRRLEAPDGPALAAALQARQVLLFAVTPDTFGLPANFPPFQVQPLGDRTYVHAPALAGIAADKELKKALWLSLKKLFGV
ncbi:MAG: hypothetical protein EOO12_02980 [Chitinophagaceae bacterium]|nr:MAG: hypothetical protein EOO12_02980 [Chitinophagaceae bacterium]